MAGIGRRLIVVSNTSPITNLAAIGQFDLLRVFFERVHVPVAVVDELAHGGIDWPGRTDVDEASWVEVHPISGTLLADALRLDLDRGEAETIVLALELGADLVLLDELAGRHAAQHLGLRVMGVAGLLLRAKALGSVKAVRPLLDRLREQAGFYLSQPVYEQILRLAEED
jgi:uncharacterized protein